MTEWAPDIIAQVNQLMTVEFELPREKLIPTADLVADLGLDSLDAVDMLVFLEERLGIRLEAESLGSVKTLADVYQIAADSLGRRAGHA